MKNIKAMIISMAILVVQTSLSNAGTNDYGLPGEYLNYDVGARAAGLGGAMTGLADDVTAAFYNPAGLAIQQPIQLGVQHVQLFEDTLFDFVGFNMPLPDIGRVGLSAILLSSLGFDVRDTSFNPLNLPTSTFQGALYASYARDITPRLFVGGNVKVVHENLFGNQDTGIGIDLGLLYNPIKEFQIGLMASNVLPPQLYDQTMTTAFTLGLAGIFFDDQLLVDIDISQSLTNQDLHWKVGSQLDVYNHAVFVRAGLDDQMRVAVGVGGQYKQITLDYAAGIEALGWSHKVSLGYSFGGYQVTLVAHPRLFSPVGIKRFTTIALTVNSKYPINSWALNIMDHNGDIVRTYEGEEQIPNQLVWHGKDDRGLVVQDGKFLARLVITDSIGRTLKSNLASIEIRSHVPLTADEALTLD